LSNGVGNNVAATANPHVQGVVIEESAHIFRQLQAGRWDKGSEGRFAAGTWDGRGAEHF
jgi:hypothetical protein